METPQLLTTLSATQINAWVPASVLQAIAGPAKCDVQVAALNYTTVGVNAEKINASGVMLVPGGQGAFSEGWQSMKPAMQPWGTVSLQMLPIRGKRFLFAL